MTELLDSIEIETGTGTGTDPAYAVIWLHGLGADGNDFAPLVPELRLHNQPAVRFVFPHAPVQRITINQGMPMRAWYDILGVDLTRREDETGLRQSQQAVQDLIARENQRGIPTEHIVLAGFSQGCAMALQTGLRLDRKLAGIIGLSGYLPLAAQAAAERHAANQQTPIFLAHGTLDPVVPFARAQASHQLLAEMGYPVTWKTYSMPHSVCPAEIDDIRHFLQSLFA